MTAVFAAECVQLHTESVLMFCEVQLQRTCVEELVTQPVSPVPGVNGGERAQQSAERELAANMAPSASCVHGNTYQLRKKSPSCQSTMIVDQNALPGRELHTHGGGKVSQGGRRSAALDKTKLLIP